MKKNPLLHTVVCIWVIVLILGGIFNFSGGSSFRKSGISISVPDCPFEVVMDSSAGKTLEKYKITDVKYSFESNTVYGKSLTKFYISGTKTFDIKGKENNTSGTVFWKVYDSKKTSVVVDSGVIYTPHLCVDEKFENIAFNVMGLQKGKKYTLVFYN